MIQRLLVKSKILTLPIRYFYIEEFGEHTIKPYNIKTPSQWKKPMRKHKQVRPFPKVRANFYDALYMPGLDNQRLLEIQKQIITQGQVVISNQFVSILLYNLSKNKLMLQQTMKILQNWIPRHKGEYSSREIFGCLYGLIIHNKREFIPFFLDELRASNLQFQLSETVQIIQALNQNKQMTLEEKHQLWTENFKKSFIDNMHRINTTNARFIIIISDAFKEFEYYDEEIWDQIITLMDGKGGWIRTEILERLYPLTGTFEKAKMLFDKYYTKLSTNRNIQWRYNLEQLRFYTSEQMIAKSQQNVQMWPNFRTLLPEDKLQQLTADYERWLVSGSIKQQQEIIKDKSTSFGYAIKDRFESLTKDNVDFSKITKAQFEQLFGQYDQDMMKQKEQTTEQIGEQNQQNK